VIYLCQYFIQGDVLRNNLLVRYFGKSFVNKKETVELGIVSPHPPVTHGPGGNLMVCLAL
jgi:inositol 1,4,5-triphosphate receptor type 1